MAAAQHYVAFTIAGIVGLLAALYGGAFLGDFPLTLGTVTYVFIRCIWRPFYVPIGLRWVPEWKPWEEAKITHPGYAAIHVLGIGCMSTILVGSELVQLLAKIT